MIRYAPGDKIRLKENNREGIVTTADINGGLVVQFPGDQTFACLEKEVEPIRCPSASYLATHLQETIYKMYGEQFDYEDIKAWAAAIHRIMERRRLNEAQ